MLQLGKVGDRGTLWGLKASLALFCWLSLCCTAALADTPFDSFKAALSRTITYSLIIKAHEVSHGRTQDNTYFYQYKKPGFARSEIIAGPGSGSVGLWRGGESIIGFKKSMPFFRKRFGLHDAAVSSLRGNTLLGASFPAISAYFTQAGATFDMHDAKVDGLVVSEVSMLRSGSLDRSAAALNLEVVTKDVLDISKSTHYPVRWLRYAGDSLVEEFDLSDLEVNTPLDDSLFL